MGHNFRRYCYICGDSIDEDNGTYCTKHSDSDNHPSEPTRKYCTWCSDSRDIDADGNECADCEDRVATVSERMDALAEDYKGRREEDTPDWEWRDCPKCGITTVHVQLYGSQDPLGFFTLDPIFGPPKRSVVHCENCGHSRKD